MNALVNKCRKSKEVSYKLQSVSTYKKNKTILKLAERIYARQNEIIEANKLDVQNAKLSGLKQKMIDRLILNQEKFERIISSLKNIVSLDDPVGIIDSKFERPNQLIIQKKIVPIGVVGIIYESRPDVTVDIFALCLKTGNTVVLKGGKEALNTNKKLVEIIREVLVLNDLPEDAVQLITVNNHAIVKEFMRQNEYIDVLIPRGGAELIRSVIENSTIPVIETGTGNCHVYVDRYADLSKAIKIVMNAKTNRPYVCNACETLLVDENIADEFLPIILKSLADSNVEVRGCKKTKAYSTRVKALNEEDLKQEFLDLILAVKVVSGVDEAINHINKYGSKHSEAILTENDNSRDVFFNTVDAATVYVNASTRFTDGNEFGFGAEMGISTQKLHARGPIGLKELTSWKYLIYGNGQVRN